MTVQKAAKQPKGPTVEEVFNAHVKIDSLKKTLWKARLRIADRTKDEFLFREEDEFEKASATAIKLLEASPAARMTGAQIEAVEKVAHLWN